MNVGAPSELVIAVIAERVGWTYEEIMLAPQWLIDTLLLKWRVEGEKNRQK